MLMVLSCFRAVYVRVQPCDSVCVVSTSVQHIVSKRKFTDTMATTPPLPSAAASVAGAQADSLSNATHGEEDHDALMYVCCHSV